ncbi:sugar phosphate isomerase/epimerase family protein [Blautia producta]|uniref:sugar phosphate isomerase/epimerase family protein n=1 Tax=Blautia producta TaxID=33035 RepID=UPI0031B5E54F
MKVGIVSDCLADKSFEELLKICRELKIEQVELGCGNWSSAPHVDLDGLLESETKRDEMKGMLKDYGITISAFNCSGNPLAPGEWGKREDEVTRKTFRLSELFGLETVVMMSGLPGGGPRDEYPNWVVTSWPPETQTILKYQWEEVAVPYWKELVKVAKACGVKRLALEPHGCQLVHDVENFYRLRTAVGDDIIGFNLDPSHLFWMGADPTAVARTLKNAVYHVHVKDVRVEKPAAVNTLMDGKGVLEFAERSWNFAIPGYGHDERWWREFFVTLKMIGYDGVLSIEHEDYTMDVLEALKKTSGFIHQNMV